VPIKNNKFQKENTHTKKEQYRCQLKNFRAKKETFFEPKKKPNKSTLKIFPFWNHPFISYKMVAISTAFEKAVETLYCGNLTFTIG
jgi:hypothetical protein